jgi:hypothetical protein
MGPRRVSTTSNASGSWLLDEQCDAQRTGIWPVIPGGEIPVGSITYSQSSVYSGVSPADNATMTNGSFLDSRTATNANGPSGVIEWVRMDLGAVYQVGSVVIGTGTSNIPGGWSKIWSENRDIEYSIDGTNWTYAFTTPGIHGSQPPTVFPADGIYTYPVDFTARYIRFSKGTVGGNYVLISEFYALAPGQTYSPNPIPALSPVLWYDFADESTVGVLESGEITQVTDKGSRGWTLTKSATGPYPYYVTGINGLKCLDWGISPDHDNFLYHANNDGTPITIGEVYVVVDAAFGGTAGNYAGLLTAHNGNWYVLAYGSSLTQDGTGFDQLFINGGTSNKFSGGLFGSPSIDDPAIMQINSSSGNTIFSSSGIQIGNDRNFSNLNRGWSGLIGEYVIFPSVLSPTDRDAVQAWLAAKWGITLEGQGNG